MGLAGEMRAAVSVIRELWVQTWRVVKDIVIGPTWVVVHLWHSFQPERCARQRWPHSPGHLLRSPAELAKPCSFVHALRLAHSVQSVVQSDLFHC